MLTPHRTGIDVTKKNKTLCNKFRAHKTSSQRYKTHKFKIFKRARFEILCLHRQDFTASRPWKRDSTIQIRLAFGLLEGTDNGGVWITCGGYRVLDWERYRSIYCKRCLGRVAWAVWRRAIRRVLGDCLLISR